MVKKGVEVMKNTTTTYECDVCRAPDIKPVYCQPIACRHASVGITFTRKSGGMAGETADICNKCAGKLLELALDSKVFKL